METNRKITLAFAAGFGALALVALVSIVATQRLIRDANRVSHTYEVRSVVRMLDAQIREAKSDVRSFVITGDSSYLRRYRVGVDSAEAAFASLQRLTIDNVAQQTRLQQLRQLLDQRITSLDRTIAMRPATRGIATSGRADGPLSQQLAAGEALSTQIGAVIADVDGSEATLLAGRTASERDSEQGVRIIAIAF